jgi:hypothetical protein
MLRLNSLGALADALERAAITALDAARSGLLEGAELVKTAAQECIGQYQPAKGDVPEWAPLSPATQDDRVAQGFSADDPLLRTGALRDSIEVKPVEPDAVLVGVFDPEVEVIAKAMEFGYHNVRANRIVPPRSFIRGTAFEKSPEVVSLIERRFIEGME